MRPVLFRIAVLFSMLMVVAPDILPVFEAETAEAAPRRRRGRRASRAQSNRASQARYRQQRRARSQRVNRNRAAAMARARMNAYARTNANRFKPATVLANTPVLVSKDYHLVVSDKHSVGSLVPTGKRSTFEDLAPGQTITVTVMREIEDGDPTKITQSAAGELTGRLVKVESNSVKELTLRVSYYQYGAKAGATTNVPPVPGQSVEKILIRSQAQGVAGLFK